jgi:hypothetical protein
MQQTSRHSGFRISLLGLGAVEFAAFLMLFFFLPETASGEPVAFASLQTHLGRTVA